jgi:hypothetical protein
MPIVNPYLKMLAGVVREHGGHVDRFESSQPSAPSLVS